MRQKKHKIKKRESNLMFCTNGRNPKEQIRLPGGLKINLQSRNKCERKHIDRICLRPGEILQHLVNVGNLNVTTFTSLEERS